MSDLQLGLVAIGVFVVVGVLAYNKWQETRFRREAEGRLKSSHDDVLMDAQGPGSPTPRQPTGPKTAQGTRAERIEPTFETGSGKSVGAAHPEDKQVRPEDDENGEALQLSEGVDFIVQIEANDEIDGAAILDSAAVSLVNFSKPVALEGYSAAAGLWEHPRRDSRYSLMRAGLQLVNRQGAVSYEELATFGAGVQQAAAAAGALATIPERTDAIERARDLDEFCGNVDILIAVHIVANSAPFPGAKVRTLAESNGLSLDEDGRFRRRDGQGRVLYELGSLDGTPFRAETTRSVALQAIAMEMDVPRTPDPDRAFMQYREFAQQLAQSLDGTVVDENRSPISPAAFDKILAQVRAVQGNMLARSLPPGGHAALRLFT